MASEKRLLNKLHDDPEIRKTFQEMVQFMLKVSEPYGFSLKDAGHGPDPHESVYNAFDSCLDGIIQLRRKATTPEGAVKIGHWCAREGEGDVSNMAGWPIYWLTISHVWTVQVETGGRAGGYESLELSLWVEGKDDNTIYKAITSWVETHFPKWSVEMVQCVRR